MAAEKSKGGNGVTWWKHLLHKLDPSSSSVSVPASNGSTVAGSVTSSVEAFADGSVGNVGSVGSVVCEHHKESEEDGVRGKRRVCPCMEREREDPVKKGDPSVLDMIRSLDAFANKRIIDPSQDHWVDSLHKLMTDFYLNSTSTNVRLRALEILSMCLHDFSYVHEDLVVQSVVIKVIVC